VHSEPCELSCGLKAAPIVHNVCLNPQTERVQDFMRKESSHEGVESFSGHSNVELDLGKLMEALRGVRDSKEHADAKNTMDATEAKNKDKLDGDIEDPITEVKSKTRTQFYRSSVKQHGPISISALSTCFKIESWTLWAPSSPRFVF